MHSSAKLGDTCYANSALQCLLRLDVEPWQKFLAQQDAAAPLVTALRTLAGALSRPDARVQVVPPEFEAALVRSEVNNFE